MGFFFIVGLLNSVMSLATTACRCRLTDFIAELDGHELLPAAEMFSRYLALRADFLQATRRLRHAMTIIFVFNALSFLIFALFIIEAPALWLTSSPGTPRSPRRSRLADARWGAGRSEGEAVANLVVGLLLPAFLLLFLVSSVVRFNDLHRAVLSAVVRAAVRKSSAARHGSAGSRAESPAAAVGQDMCVAEVRDRCAAGLPAETEV